jgi:hypothetical protein
MDTDMFVGEKMNSLPLSPRASLKEAEEEEEETTTGNKRKRR